MAGKMLVFAFLLALGAASAEFPYCTTGLSGPIPSRYVVVKLPDLELAAGQPSWLLTYGTPTNCEDGVLQVTVCDVVPPYLYVQSNTEAIVVRKGDLSLPTVAKALYYCPLPYKSAQKGSSEYNKKPVAVPWNEEVK